MDRSDVRAWLDEDNAFDDATSHATVPEGALARGRIVAKEPLVLAGIETAVAVFEGTGCTATPVLEDGTHAKAGDVLLEVEGGAHAVLGGERTALNALMHLSGVATLTARVAEIVRTANPACKVLATRKTVPGLRGLVHDAVVAGGGEPHRKDLAEAILVKENHLAFVSVGEAVKSARRNRPGVFVMVEAETPEEAAAVARADADGVLIDNFRVGDVADTVELVKRLKPDIVVEASGGITLETVGVYARYVDRVSLGVITHSAPAVDVSLEVEAAAD